jgi:hypothetical protein
LGWIKFEKDLLTDPRVLRMARIISNLWKVTDEGDPSFIGNGTPLPAVTLVCGALARLWCLADTHVDQDDTMPLGFEEIDEYVGIPGFCLQMPHEWLHRIDEHTVKLPNFHAHNGTEAKGKALTQKRVERFRKRHETPLPTRNVQSLPDQDLDQDLKKHKPARQRSPSVSEKEEEVILPDWLPKEQWKAWLDVRKKIKAPNTPRALKLALAELERLKSQGYAPAAVLDQATVKGWKFPYPLKEGLPATEPAGKLCDYCTKVSSGNVNGRRACDEHWSLAMDNVSPIAKLAESLPRRMLGVVAKPVAGRD